MDGLLAMLNGMSLSDRHWLVDNLSEQIAHEEKQRKARLDVFLTRNESDTWKEKDDALLDAMLAKFSGDWGGNGTPSEIAKDLRQGPEMVRQIETW